MTSLVFIAALFVLGLAPVALLVHQVWRVARLRARRRRSVVALLVGAMLPIAAQARFAHQVWNCGGSCPAQQEILACESGPNAILVDRHGVRIGALAKVNWQPLPKQLPAHVLFALVDVEDRRFRRHSGVDVLSIGRAVWRNLRAIEIVEGFSTIEMQLARTVFLRPLRRDRSLQGRLKLKVMEMRTALRLDEIASKDQILRCYANSIGFGGQIVGLQAAAQELFNKSAERLWIFESATLAAIPNAPSLLNPRSGRVDLLHLRRNKVLRAMHASSHITAIQLKAASARPTSRSFVTNGKSESSDCIADMVGAELHRLGIEDEVARVETAIDRRSQAAATAVIEQQSARIAAVGGTKRDPQAAMVVLAPQTGAIRTIVCGNPYRAFNYAMNAERQPGSVAKIFPMIAFFEAGGTPASSIDDTPIVVTTKSGATWSPRNFRDEYEGPTTVQKAIAHSRNSAVVRLTVDVGVDAVAEVARRLGISSPLPMNPMIALGVFNARPVQIATVFATIGNGGYRITPWLISRAFSRDGRVIYERRQTHGKSVLDTATIRQTIDVLETVVDSGTATVIRNLGVRGRVAGKTGTTTANTDAWFGGLTDDLAAAVWFGFERPTSMGAQVTGGNFAAAAFGEYLRRLKNDAVPVN